MEVDRCNFANVLPTILKRIADSDFIAFDLEFSGIPPQRQRDLAGKATLQDRYEDVKAAAETYHVHQFGLTCAEKLHRHNDDMQYSLRAFNFHISPLIAENFGVDRKFSYSSSAVQFLMGYGHRMETPFVQGIPYLSREEEKTVAEQARRKIDRFTIPDIVLRDDDQSAKDLVEIVKRDLQEWINEQHRGDAVYFVGGRDSSSSDLRRPLNRFEKRLVHQTVRGSFADYQTYSRDDYVKVQYKDYQEDMHDRNELHNRILADVSRQTGFRWVAEALCGGNMERLFDCVSRDLPTIQDASTPENRGGYRYKLQELQRACQERPKILVGHNCFMDFAFFYKIFYGSLPDRVEDFQNVIHEMFPLIVDTKYLSTCGKDSRFRGARLAQLDTALSHQKEPLIEQSSIWHERYDDSESAIYHEAGFDSLVTARTFLRLASKLTSASGADDFGKLDQEKRLAKPPLKEEVNAEPTNPEYAEAKPAVAEDSEAFSEHESLSDHEDTPSQQATKNNPFDILTGIPQEENAAISSKGPTLSPIKNVAGVAENPISTSHTGKASLGHSQKPSLNQQDDIKPRDPPIPLFPSSIGSEDDKERGRAFWQQYGNKLRIYGTVEEMCDLANVAAIAEGKEPNKATAGVTAKAKEVSSVTETKAHWLWEWLWSWLPGWKSSR
ncbi:MAG: hypothetical protein M1831_002135 [Alyxoria varia]|nr:MAG: hypothetical protein M1831_002135 [Alyxoria varia]